MDILKTIILGIVEGTTEYLPVSSTGHLIIFGEWMNFNEQFAKVFDIFIQSGAVLAALIIFWKDIFGFSAGRKKVFDNWKKLFVAFLPAAFAGLLFADFIQEKLFNSPVVAFSLIAGGILLLFLDRKPVEEKEGGSELTISYGQALMIGFFQCLALVPGVSRSASTIIGGLLGGMDRKNAAKFSFMLAIPTLGAAGFYSLFKYRQILSENLMNIWLLLIGFAVSFVVAYVVIEWFIRFLQKHNFFVFGIYRIILGLFIIFLYYLL